MNLPEDYSWLISCSRDDFEQKYKQLHIAYKSSENNYKSLQLRHALLGEKSCKIAQREAILRNQVIVLETLHKNPGEAFKTLQTKYKEVQDELLIQTNCIGELTRLAQQITIEAEKNKVDLRERNVTIHKLGKEQREELAQKDEQIRIIVEQKETQSKLISKLENMKHNSKDKEGGSRELKDENKQINEKLAKKRLDIEILRGNDMKHRRNMNMALESMKILKSQLSSAGIIPLSTPADDKFGTPTSPYPVSPGPQTPIHTSGPQAPISTPGPQTPVSNLDSFDSQAAQNWANLEAEKKKNKVLSLEIKALNNKIMQGNELAKKKEEHAMNLIEQKAKKYLEIVTKNEKESKEKQEFDSELIAEKKREIAQLRDEIAEKKVKQEFDKGLIEEKNVEIGELRIEVEVRKKTSDQLKQNHKQFEECKIKEIEQMELDMKNLKSNNMQLIAEINKMETRLATKSENGGIEEEVQIKRLSAENAKLQMEIQSNRQKWQLHKENLKRLKSSIPNVQQFQGEILDHMRNGNWALEKDIQAIKGKLIDWSNNYRVGILEERVDCGDEIADLKMKLSVAVAQNELQADDFVQLKKEFKLVEKRIKHMEGVQTSEDKYYECKAKRPKL